MHGIIIALSVSYWCQWFLGIRFERGAKILFDDDCWTVTVTVTAKAIIAAIEAVVVMVDNRNCWL